MFPRFLNALNGLEHTSTHFKIVENIRIHAVDAGAEFTWKIYPYFLEEKLVNLFDYKLHAGAAPSVLYIQFVIHFRAI